MGNVEALTSLRLAFNHSKRKLELEQIILKNLPKLSDSEKIAYFADFRFFNPLISYNKNKAIKQNAAMYLNYDGIIVFGDKEENYFYKREIKNKKSITEYYPNGFVKRSDTLRFEYDILDFKRGIYRTITKTSSHGKLSYVAQANTAIDWFSLSFLQNKKFFVTNVEYTQQPGKDVLLVFSAPFNKFDLLRASIPDQLRMKRVSEKEVLLCLK